jgi:hypothetical protein
MLTKRKSVIKPLSVVVEQSKLGPLLKFRGTIDESVDWQKITIPAGNEIHMDLGGVELINSAGGRGWVNWIYSINRSTQLKLLNCGRVFIDYVNTIHGFVPANGRIISFQIPYFCGKCGASTQIERESEMIHKKIQDIPRTMSCSCGSTAELDVLDPAFFKFLDNQL